MLGVFLWLSWWLSWGCLVALVGFCGSRSLPSSFAGLVSSVVRAVLSAGRRVAVGCAAGGDLFVRSAAPGARVFRVSAFAGGGGPPRAAFVRRSVALVRAVAASGSGAGFVGFVSCGCPRSVSPSASPSRCFCGGGSGSWASLAFAAGLGVPVVVFGCFPAGGVSLPPWWGGSWAPASASGPWAGGWRWSPPASFAVQGALF